MLHAQINKSLFTFVILGIRFGVYILETLPHATGLVFFAACAERYKQ